MSVHTPLPDQVYFPVTIIADENFWGFQPPLVSTRMPLLAYSLGSVSTTTTSSGSGHIPWSPRPPPPLPLSPPVYWVYTMPPMDIIYMRILYSYIAYSGVNIEYLFYPCYPCMLWVLQVYLIHEMNQFNKKLSWFFVYNIFFSFNTSEKNT